MRNLAYCTRETREMIESILASPGTHNRVKKAIIDGLNADSLDAYKDYELVADIMRRVYNHE